MKKIGLVGGIGPASTVEYYLSIIKKCRIEQRGNIYPEIVIDSVNMLSHDKALAENDYDKLAHYLLRSLSNLKAAGAELAAITANTEHIVWNMVHSKFPLPVISIVEATIREIKRKGFKNVLVFGTMFTLKSKLYENALNNQGITAIIPSGNDISTIDSLIYPNMENGIIIPADKQKLVKMAEKYISEKNADSILLGCTELPLAITYCDVSVPILNTTEIHINEIYRRATQV
ncbi:amino acid racemase [Taurinivorans muris]|uniref:Amino acid racemase n=1 Tax=Taurinivorans muris TaxID=2787751 RepID=A0ABY5XYW9_9BACT|nr:amino acid racemase [Desulfovibrionaceae bacterium LT0009]